MSSNSLLLDASFEGTDAISLLFAPTPAQMGALRCHEDLGRRTNRTAWDDPTDDGIAALTHLWRTNASSFWTTFARTIQEWALFGDPASGGAIGYWLTWVRKHGIQPEKVEQLTRFLAEPRFEPKHYASRSVRRYPTGAVSEKQAILLPAVLRFLSDSLDFHSSFLIARRLAHTGGTSDKLRVLPGFSVQSASNLHSWDGTLPSVRYFTADATFCPRDEVLYFLRGETGTVRELGLIVASIAAKQFALQTDLTLLDILHGDGAFFQTVDEAEAFQRLAQSVSTSLNFSTHFSIRSTSEVSWKSVGNATEVAEIVDLLRKPAAAALPEKSELARAAVFAAHLVSGLGIRKEEVASAIFEAWHEGRLFLELIGLWSDHHVDSQFLQDVQAQGSSAILGNLNSKRIVAQTSGTLHSKNLVQLADLVNNHLNSYRSGPGGLPSSAAVGGIVLGVALDERIEAGQTLVDVYCSDVIEPTVLEGVLENLVISEDS